MDIEQKLSLIQQIHREQEENERYIYDNLRRRSYKQGTEYFPVSYENYEKGYRKDFQKAEATRFGFASFRFRLVAAVLLFLCFLIMDKKEYSLGEITSAKILDYIDNNMTITDFIVQLEQEIE